jgi:hypothetical protein
MTSRWGFLTLYETPPCLEKMGEYGSLGKLESWHCCDFLGLAKIRLPRHFFHSDAV